MGRHTLREAVRASNEKRDPKTIWRESWTGALRTAVIVGFGGYAYGKDLPFSILVFTWAAVLLFYFAIYWTIHWMAQARLRREIALSSDADAPTLCAPTRAIAAIEEKTGFEVVLTAAGEQRLHVIRVVREITSLGLKEAKELVFGAPQPIRQGVTRDEADQMKKEIEEVGGQVVIKMVRART